MWLRNPLYRGQRDGFFIASNKLEESVPIITSSSHKSLRLRRTHSKHSISADNLSGDGAKASLACIPTAPIWSLVIQAPLEWYLLFLQLVWKLHFTSSGVGGVHCFGTPRSLGIGMPLLCTLFKSCHNVASSNAVCTKRESEIVELQHRLSYFYFSISSIASRGSLFFLYVLSFHPS